ncbi:MAG: MFS transporter [Thermoprotei archaeon]
MCLTTLRNPLGLRPQRIWHGRRFNRGGIGAVAAPLFTSIISRKVRREELNRVMSAFTAISSYAGSAGTLLTGLNYSTLFLLGILLSLVSTVIVIPVKEGVSGPKVTNGTTREEVPEKRQRTYMRVFAVSKALNGVSQGLVVPFMPVVFKEYFGLSNAEIGRMYFVVGILTATLMLLLSSRLSEAMGVGRFIFVSRTVSALSGLLIPLVKEETIAIALFVAFMSFRVLPLPSQQALIVAVRGKGEGGLPWGSTRGPGFYPSLLRALRLAT